MKRRHGSQLSAIAQHAVRRTGALFGQPVAVAGLGPLGQLVLQYAAVAGASELFAVARGEARLSAAAGMVPPPYWQAESPHTSPRSPTSRVTKGSASLTT